MRVFSWCDSDTPLIRNQGEEVVSGMRQVGGGQLLVADDVVDGTFDVLSMCTS